MKKILGFGQIYETKHMQMSLFFLLEQNIKVATLKSYGLL